jgi:multidrug efflux pump subunit AcrA (membrane-fusion protein)
MKFVYVLLVTAAAGLGVRWWMGPQAATTPTVATLTTGSVAAPAPAATTSLGEATVLISRSYMLRAPTSSRVKRSYIELGQVVKKGAILLKFENYNFLVAPATGIVTQQLVAYTEYVPHSAPVARFTELYPFRLRLPLLSSRVQLKPGDLLQVQDNQHPTQRVTGVVVASSLENGARLLDLRLRSLSQDPIQEGDSVQVNILATKP